MSMDARAGVNVDANVDVSMDASADYALDGHGYGDMAGMTASCGEARARARMMRAA